MKRLLVALLVVALVVSLSAVTVSAKPSKPLTPPDLEQVIYVHYGKDKPGKPDKPPGKPEPEPEEPSEPVNDYYELTGYFLVGTAKYYVNPNAVAPGGNGIEIPGAVAAVSSSFETWDEVTGAELFDDAVGTTAKYGIEQDWQNTVSWQTIVPPKIIAICAWWAYTGVDPNTLEMEQAGQIAEFDIVLNAKHDWVTMAGYVADAFIIENITTHEAGHVVGLDDLYDDIYCELTMYGYSEEGETIKIDLEVGDIAGAQELYETP